ncbi:MAG: sigma-70 family RNA polymerase sigma factor [Rickettsiales bacterium]|jgi:RNA polymerase primary sigma factor|nr:sigma-70 family RNA polymerase sigma factor [Rickettsiales bacterium]
MPKIIDDATTFLKDNLPKNLKKLADSALSLGYLSQMEFDAAVSLDEIPDNEQDEVLSFFQKDLGVEILETSIFDEKITRYEDEDDSEKDTRDDIEPEQVDVNSDDYDFYAKQLERSQLGNLVLGAQDSVQSYLKQIGGVQLLTAAGEVAIAKRIETASCLLVYSLCESPLTIKTLLEWYEQLLADEIRLRYIVNLELMYSNDFEKRSLAAISNVLKSKGVDSIEDLGDEDLDEVEEEFEEEEEAAEENTGKENARGSSGVPIPVMEESLMPVITETFTKIKKIFNQMVKFQKMRMDNLLKTAKLDDALEKKYEKLRFDLFDQINKLKLNEDRVEEILDQLIKRNQLLVGLEGKLLRLAVGIRVKRDDFLAEYSGNELNRNWVKKLLKHKNPALVRFATKHGADIEKIQDSIIEIANEIGQPTSEYRRVVELVRLGQAETARAKREMIEANLRLVINFAKKHSNRGLGLDLSDLIQDGNLGLMKAVDKFDYRLGNKFSTYATHWIQQGINRSIADQARTIRIPVHMIDNIHKIQKATRLFVHKHSRQPTDEELSKIIYLPVEKIQKAKKVNLKPVSLEGPIGTDDDSSRIETIADETAKNPFVSATQKNLRKIVTQILSELDGKEESVIRMRFGMSSNKTSTLEEVGEYIGVTRERIRQIEQKALQKLKHPTRARKLRSFLED